MDQYWDQLLQNIIGSPIDKTTKSKLKVWTNADKYEEIVESVSTEIVEKVDVKDATKRTRNKRKQKAKEKSITPTQGMKNVSLTSDEGIDISYNPVSATVTSIPKVILRPQHQLQSSWSFWFSVGDKNLSWERNQIKICTVSTIEQFWYVTCQLQPPSNISTGHTYSVFRAGVLPDWEDMANVSGGRWMIPCPKRERDEKLNEMWQDILIMMVGEHMEEYSGLVNGAEACLRKKGDRIEVWMKDVGLMKGVVEIGRKIKERLKLDASRKLRFSIHKEDQEGVKGPRIGL